MSTKETMSGHDDDAKALEETTHGDGPYEGDSDVGGEFVGVPQEVQNWINPEDLKDHHEKNGELRRCEYATVTGPWEYSYCSKPSRFPDVFINDYRQEDRCTQHICLCYFDSGKHQTIVCDCRSNKCPEEHCVSYCNCTDYSE